MPLSKEAIAKALEGVKDEGVRSAFELLFKAMNSNKSPTGGGKRQKVPGETGHEDGEGENLNAGDDGADAHDNAARRQSAPGNTEYGGDHYCKSVQDAMLGLYEAVEAISKAEDVDVTKELRAAFEKAFGDISALVEESQDMAYVAGVEKAKKGTAADPDGDGDDDSDGEDDDMSKILKSAGASGPVRSLIKGLMKSQEQLVNTVKSLTQAREDEQLAKRAEEVGETAAFAQVLKGITDPKLRDQVANLVKSKNEAIRKGGLFSEVGGGSGNSGSTSAYDKLVGHANETVTKSVAAGKPLTFAKAFQQACTQHPELYREHQSEMRGSR